MTTITDEQVEAAAKALFEFDEDADEWRNAPSSWKDTSRKQARAVLTAAAKTGKPEESPIGNGAANCIGFCYHQIKADNGFRGSLTDVGFAFIHDLEKSGYKIVKAAAHEGERVEPPLPAAPVTASLSESRQGEPSPELQRGQESDEAGRGTTQLSNLPDADPSRHKGASPSASVGIGERAEDTPPGPAPATPGRADDGDIEWALTDEQLKELERRYVAYVDAVNKPRNSEKEWTDLTMGMLGALPEMLREIWRSRASDGYNRVAAASTSPSPPAQSNWLQSADGTETIRERRPDDASGEHSVQSKRLEKELRDYVITGHNPDGPPPIRFHPRIFDEAADRIATLTKELAEARKVIELNVSVTSAGICGTRSRLSILLEINKMNHDWLERNKP